MQYELLARCHRVSFQNASHSSAPFNLENAAKSLAHALSSTAGRLWSLCRFFEFPPRFFAAGRKAACRGRGRCLAGLGLENTVTAVTVTVIYQISFVFRRCGRGMMTEDSDSERPTRRPVQSESRHSGWHAASENGLVAAAR
jgi:hypothetical protein